MSNPDDDYMDPILERKHAEAEQNRSERRHPGKGGSEEERIEEQERGALYGPFKAQYVRWFVILLVVAFAAFVMGYYFYFLR